MTRYATGDEEAVRAAARVRDWKQSGLLDAARAEAIEGELRTGLRRTHWALRGVLFVFAGFVIQSTVGLIVVAGMPSDEAVVAGLAIVAGAGCFWIADILVARYALYRFGVEEACAVCAVVLVAGGLTVSASTAGFRDEALAIVALVTATLMGGLVYWRFGLLYCAVAAAGCAAAVSFFVGLSEMAARLLAASVLLVIHVVAVRMREPCDDDYPGDDYGVIESVTWLGLYAMLNLELTAFLPASERFSPVFFWGTYVAIWVLPLVGLYRGVRRKHRWMIRASLLMLLVTLVTNKPYLGWERHTWDPILLGVLLIGAALGVRRWLLSGVEGHRHGFTPHRLLRSDESRMAEVAMGAAAFKPDQTIRDAAPAEVEKFGGGRSGGAGATGGF